MKLSPPHTAARALLRPGRSYEQAVEMFSPYREVKEEYPSGREALRGLIESSFKRGLPAYIHVNNRFEGNAIETIDGVVRKPQGLCSVRRFGPFSALYFLMATLRSILCSILLPTSFNPVLGDSQSQAQSQSETRAHSRHVKLLLDLRARREWPYQSATARSDERSVPSILVLPLA
jgi:hypothetical protein